MQKQSILKRTIHELKWYQWLIESAISNVWQILDVKAKISGAHNSWNEMISVFDTRHTSALVFQCQVASSVLSKKNLLKNLDKSHQKKWMESTQEEYMWSCQSYPYQIMTIHLFSGHLKIITGFIIPSSFQHFPTIELSFLCWSQRFLSVKWSLRPEVKSAMRVQFGIKVLLVKTLWPSHLF